MKKYVLLMIMISGFLISTSQVSASRRVIYNFTQLTDTSGEIALNWNVDDITDEIQVITYYLTKDNVLEVIYRTGQNIPKGFNKMTIKNGNVNFPVRIVLKEQKVDKDTLTDLPENKINRYDILNLYDRGIINGYKDNTFKPGNRVRRAEFFAMLVAAAAYKMDTESESIFSDVANEFWGKEYIMTLANKGVVSGSGNGLCNPNGEITIGEVLALIDRTFTFHNKSGVYKEPTGDHWSNDNFIKVARASIVKDGDAFYYPYNPELKATRQQCATLLSRVLLTNYNVN